MSSGSTVLEQRMEMREFRAGSPDMIPRTLEVIRTGMREGMHRGAQVSVRLHGVACLDFALGEAVEGIPLTNQHVILWLSAGKPLTAMAVALLWQRGMLSLEDTVASHLPGFGEGGKKEITLWHLLTHTAGFVPPALDWPRLPREEVLRKIFSARMPEERVPGSWASYDPQAGWYLLDDIVHHLVGMPARDFIRGEILEPLGCTNTRIGLDEAEYRNLVAAGRLARLHDSSPGDPANMAPWPGDDELRARAHNPGGGACGPVCELSLFYQELLDGLKDKGSVFSRETVEKFTHRHRVGMMDAGFRMRVDWGLGFLVNSIRYGMDAYPYGYGRHAGDDTFGHGGMQSTSAYADPGCGLAVAATFNGLPGEARHNRRIRDFNTALYEDLDLPRRG